MAASDEWPPELVGLIAAALEVGDRVAVDLAFRGLSDNDTLSLAGAVIEYLERLAHETGSWRICADALWILPHRWGKPAREFQGRIDSAVAAANIMSPKKRVQKVIARVAVDLVGDGVEDRDLLVRLDAYNKSFLEPLQNGDVKRITIWARKAMRPADPPARHPVDG